MLARAHSFTATTLFSGIGAPETAMPHWRWAWSAEIEKFPAAVLAARQPDSVNLGDVTADDFSERARAVARPDILVFGSPCQDFSVAGKRLGMAGARGNLALIALGIVGRIKPSWFVFENVPGLLSNWSGAEEGPAETGAEWESDENCDFAAFLGSVDELRYSGAWASLDARYRGVAQRRERLFFVGHSGDWRAPSAVLFEPESLSGHNPPRREPGENVAPTIAARTRGGGGSPRGHGTAGLNSQAVASGQIVAFSCKDYGADAGALSPTLRAMGHDASHANAGGQVAIIGPAVRRLTPREWERLQGFPDDYTLITYRGKPAADGPRYKALGNSMAVPVMRWILSRIETVSRLSHAA